MWKSKYSVVVACFPPGRAKDLSAPLCFLASPGLPRHFILLHSTIGVKYNIVAKGTVQVTSVSQTDVTTDGRSVCHCLARRGVHNVIGWDQTNFSTAPRFPKAHSFWKVPRHRPFVLVRAAPRCRWVWSLVEWWHSRDQTAINLNYI